MIITHYCNLGLLFILTITHAGVISAHEGHKHPADGEHASASLPVPTAIRLPDIEGPRPWSSAPALDDPQRFSIAIMTDRTGGHRPGIWMKAVGRINWLRPDFVVSVGDLIEGYTEDVDQIEAQWQEFLGFIDQMEMKFFFVAGNHDVTNPTMHRIWREKFGREWYSFDYRGVHFICLSSEDPEASIGPEQYRWLSEDLAKSADARWTLVFMHKPLWVYAEREISAGNDDPTGWKEVEKLLRDRPHTVFAGHVHNYVQYSRNGQHYFTLATTGGGSRLRGVDYGEFDHITWLTMEKDGPRVANLLLDGILPADAVKEEQYLEFVKFVDDVRLTASPIFVEKNKISHGEIQLDLANEFGKPVSVRAEISGMPLVGLNLSEQQIVLQAAAGESRSVRIPFEFSAPVDLGKFRETTVEAIIQAESGRPLKATVSIPVLVVQKRQLRQQTVTVDGDFGEWNHAWMPNATEQLVVDPENNWKGQSDGSLQIAAAHDESKIYFRVQVADDNLTDGDRLVVAVDPRNIHRRLSRNQLSEETIAAVISPPVPGAARQACEIVAYNRSEPLPGMAAYGELTDTGYEIEVSLPIDNVVQSQGSDWSSIQIGARLYDVDSESEQPVEILWNSSRNIFANRDYIHAFRRAD